MAEYVNLVLFCGGKWKSKTEKVYEGGQIRYKYNIDIDYLSFFELLRYGKDFGYKSGCQVWYKILGISRNEGIVEISDDKHVSYMLQDNKGDEEICLFYTAPIHPLGIAVDGKIYATDPNEIGIKNFDDNDLEEDVGDFNEDEDNARDISSDSSKEEAGEN